MNSSYLVFACLGLCGMAVAVFALWALLVRKRTGIEPNPPVFDHLNPYQPTSDLMMLPASVENGNQVNNPRNVIVLPLACALGGVALGVVSRKCRDLISGSVHYETLVSLVVLCVSSLLIVFVNRKAMPKSAHLLFQLENSFLWLGHALCWLVVNQSLWDDFVFFAVAMTMVTALIGSALLSFVCYSCVSAKKGRGPRWGVANLHESLSSSVRHFKTERSFAGVL